MDADCSQCGRKVIDNDIDICFWLGRVRRGIQEYTCAFCELGLEPNSEEAIVRLGRYGGVYPRVESILEYASYMRAEDKIKNIPSLL